MPYMFNRVSFAGKCDSLVRDGDCKHYTHLARSHTRKFFRACGSRFDETRVFGLQDFSARHLGPIIAQLACHVQCTTWSTFHGTNTEHLDFLFPTVRFKLDTICYSAVWPICRTIPSQVMSPALRLKRAVKQHFLFYLREGAVSNLLVMTSLLLLVRLWRVTNRTWDGWPHHWVAGARNKLDTHLVYLFLTRVQALFKKNVQKFVKQSVH